MALEAVSERLIEAVPSLGSRLLKFGLAALFIIGVVLYTLYFGEGRVSMTLVIAAGFGAYMAMGIGANDVANNVGPSVGSGALTLGGALLIAAIFEAAGALIAGGNVTETIRKGIIDPELIPDAQTFVWMMLAALLAAAMWLNLATAVGAPVSTTHSIVGAVLGAGVASAGFGVADWGLVGKIAASWVISPLTGGVIAAAFLYAIKHGITYQNDMAAAAGRNVPLLVALMAWAFVSYLLIKGLGNIFSIALVPAVLYGFVVAFIIFLLIRPVLRRNAGRIENSKSSVNTLFNVPLIFASALLCFAHGSNDVANAVGPLAAIVDVLTASAGQITGQATIPLWVMMIGALGLSVGLALFGPRVIRTIGSEVTDLDQIRAYSIAMSATITVIIASQLGLPISSTHTAVGAVFGVGFLREYLKTSYARRIEEIKQHHAQEEQHVLDKFLHDFEVASAGEKKQMLKDLKKRAKKDKSAVVLSKRERKSLRKVNRAELVKRSLVFRIVAAWIITVPASAIMAAIVFYTIRGMLLPG